ncbi:MAG: heat-inducible transcriptional repressor HrcA [Alphaproteobacteria bacterium]|nr:heat-inducible transcriptional repressor HrcA [Alphaproteobacteria bacterium]
MLRDLNQRSREILRLIVDEYLATGEPVGSRTLSRRFPQTLSPASIRGVMADLEEAGLLYAPHTSAGRLPTERGLRLFVDGLLEVGDLTETERRDIDNRARVVGRNVEQALTEATERLSGLANAAALVAVPKHGAALAQIEFVPLAPGRALAVVVTADGQVENRVIDAPSGLGPAGLTQAGNYLTQRLRGRTFAEARAEILAEIQQHRSELDALSARVVESGLAAWGGEADGRSTLIVKGQARLLEDVSALGDLERMRELFGLLESRQELLKVLDSTDRGEGVRIFIGRENQLFAMSGCAMIVAPLRGARQTVVGAIGVIGPTRLNYARIIPMVDYTARVVGKILG